MRPARKAQPTLPFTRQPSAAATAGSVITDGIFPASRKPRSLAFAADCATSGYPSRAVMTRYLLLFFLMGSPYAADATVIEQLIAVVDGEPYTLSNVRVYAKAKFNRAFPAGDLKEIGAGDREVLEQFLTDKLLEAEVREAGISVSDAEVERYIDQVKKNNRLTDDDLKLALSRENHTLASYKASVKAEMEKSNLIDRQVRRKITISDEDVERYYQLNAKNYRTNERAHIRHILLALEENAPPERVESVTEKARELYRRIAGGEDFAALAREHSQGAGQAEGGDIGWVTRGTLIAGIEEAAFRKLSVGQVSEPFRTSMGLHIVKLEARDAGKPVPLSSVAPRIKEELLNKALEERFAKWVKNDLRRKHRVDIKIAGVVFKPEDSQEGTVGGLMAKTNRSARTEDRSFLSYLNPLSYIVKETRFEGEGTNTETNQALQGKNIVSVFGVPLFATDSVEDTPDVFAPPQEPEKKGAASSLWDSLNPFSSKNP
jgi:peptidyl-prolyl cis-trans isomerase SurA